MTAAHPPRHGDRFATTAPPRRGARPRRRAPAGGWHAVRVPRFVHAAPGVTLWAQTVPGPATDPVLLVADAGASLALWPQPLITALAAHHPVICYDHRDTGRSRTSTAAGPGAYPDRDDDATATPRDADPEPTRRRPRRRRRRRPRRRPRTPTPTATAIPTPGRPPTAWPPSPPMRWPCWTPTTSRGPTCSAGAWAGSSRSCCCSTTPSASPPPRWWPRGRCASPARPRFPGRPSRCGGCGPSWTTPATARASWRGAWRTTGCCTAPRCRSTPPCSGPGTSARWPTRAARSPSRRTPTSSRPRGAPSSRPSPCRRWWSRRPPTPSTPRPRPPHWPPPLGRARLVGIPGLGHVVGDRAAAQLAEIVVDHTMSIPTSA